ncbi:MAG TPA: hypothetical protein ENN46_04485 [Candidatus Woesearchaeota archaeon]|nr:hypothetical protein [Candidatus Woesearchaeota archaeon]
MKITGYLKKVFHGKNQKEKGFSLDKAAHLRNPQAIASRIIFLVLTSGILLYGVDKRNFLLIGIGAILLISFLIFFINGFFFRLSLTENEIRIHSITERISIKKKNIQSITKIIPKNKNLGYRDYIIEYEDDEESEITKRRLFGVKDFMAFEEQVKNWGINISPLSKRRYNRKTVLVSSLIVGVMIILFIAIYFSGNQRQQPGEKPEFDFFAGTDGNESLTDTEINRLGFRMQSALRDLNQGHLFEGVEKPMQARKVFVASEKLLVFSTDEKTPRFAILYLFSDTTINFSVRLCFDEKCEVYSELSMKTSDFSEPPAFITSRNSPLLDIMLITSVNDIRGVAFFTFELNKIKGIWLEKVQLKEQEFRKDEQTRVYEVKEVVT